MTKKGGVYKLLRSVKRGNLIKKINVQKQFSCKMAAFLHTCSIIQFKMKNMDGSNENLKLHLL